VSFVGSLVPVVPEGGEVDVAAGMQERQTSRIFVCFLLCCQQLTRNPRDRFAFNRLLGKQLVDQGTLL